jgi:hypothetical protein
MIRYLVYLFIYLFMLCVAALLTPFLPMFASIRVGGINNDDHQGAGLRLPLWLSWFDTPDNALTGDEAFEAAHPMGTYWDMVTWLYRNPLYGFKWTVLGAPMEGLRVTYVGDRIYFADKYFQIRTQSGLTFGWILDAYYRRTNSQQKAIFIFWK